MRPHRHRLYCTILAISLLGCDKANSAPSGKAPGTSYELVTVERPESLEAYHQLYKAGYDMCVHTREMLIRDGKMYNSSVDADGKRQSQPADEWFLPREKAKDTYTERKTVKGFAVKCMNIPASTTEMISELCIADLNPGTITDAIGKPIVLVSRVGIVQKMMGVIVTEPVSMRVNQAVDKAVFDAAAAP